MERNAECFSQIEYRVNKYISIKLWSAFRSNCWSLSACISHVLENRASKALHVIPLNDFIK